MSDTNDSVWMSAKDVMAMLECSRRVLVKLVQNGDIVRRQTSAHRRYLRSSVEKLAESQKIPQSA